MVFGKNTKKKIIFRFRRRKKSLFSSWLKQREIVDNNVQLSNKELPTLNWRLFCPYFVDNILQFYHETHISYILDDFRQYYPRIEDNIVYFSSRQYCPFSKWTYFLGSTRTSRYNFNATITQWLNSLRNMSTLKGGKYCLAQNQTILSSIRGQHYI